MSETRHVNESPSENRMAQIPVPKHTPRRFGTHRLLGAALVLTLAGCGGAAPQADTAEVAESAGGEAAAATSNEAAPMQIDDPAMWDVLLSQGTKSYAKACDACHPGGQKDLGPSLIDLKMSAAVMTRQIREGSGRMKGVSEKRLPERDMKGLLVYLSTLGAVSDVQGPAQ